MVTVGNLPIILPLLVSASIERWVRRHSWREVVKGPWSYAGIGALVGLVALALAIVAGTPVAEALTDRAVQWSQFPVVRGSLIQFAVVAIVVAALAASTELVLRGWLVERVLERGARAGWAVATGALAEALLTDGDLAARLGAAVFASALGWMYVAGGRSVVAPACARVAFGVGALALEALRWLA